ncbi:MAG: hypothetical protein ABIF82_06480 [Planctomycetota bacterium]
MKKKQKRVLMIGLGVLAAILCAVQLGPIFLGGKPKKEGPKKPVGPRVAKKQNDRPRVAKSGEPRTAPRAGTARKRPPPPTGTGSAQEDVSAWPLESIAIDLTAVGRRALTYEVVETRDPFGAAKFERARASSALTKATFKLQGVVCGGRSRPDGTLIRLAIIDNKVYAEGQEVIKGVRVAGVDATSVVLAEGKAQLRLFLTGTGPRGMDR